MQGLFLFLAGVIFLISPAILFLLQTHGDERDDAESEYLGWLVKLPLDHIQKISLMQHVGLLMIFVSFVFPH